MSSDRLTLDRIPELVRAARKTLPPRSDRNVWNEAYMKRARARANLRKLDPDLVKDIYEQEEAAADEGPIKRGLDADDDSRKRPRRAPAVEELLGIPPSLSEWSESVFGPRPRQPAAEEDIKSSVDKLKNELARFCQVHFCYRFGTKEQSDEFNLSVLAEHHPELLWYVKFVAQGGGEYTDQWKNYFIHGEYRWMIGCAVIAKALEIFAFGEPMFGATREQRVALQEFDKLLVQKDGFQRSYLRQRFISTLLEGDSPLPTNFFSEANILTSRIFNLIKPLFHLDAYPYCSSGEPAPRNYGASGLSDLFDIIYQAAKISFDMHCPETCLADPETGILLDLDVADQRVYYVTQPNVGEAFDPYTMSCLNIRDIDAWDIQRPEHWEKVIRMVCFPEITSHRQATHIDKAVYESDTSDVDSEEEMTLEEIIEKKGPFPDISTLPEREKGVRRTRRARVTKATNGMSQREHEAEIARVEAKTTGLVVRQISQASVMLSYAPPVKVKGQSRCRESLAQAIANARSTAKKRKVYKVTRSITGMTVGNIVAKTIGLS